MLTGKNKEQFQKWYNDNNENHNRLSGRFKVLVDYAWVEIENLPLSMQIGVIQDYADSIGIYIHIEPHIGGGDLVFYVTVTWRNKDFIDEFWIDRFDDGEPKYYPTRDEARKAAIKAFDEIVNREL